MCNEQAELFDVFGRIASFLGKLLGHKWTCLLTGL